MCNWVCSLHWEDWIGISSPGLPKNARWSDRKRAWCLFKVAVPIDSNRWKVFVWFSIDHWLTDTNQYQLLNIFIDWYQFIDWFSNHWFPSIGYTGYLCPGELDYMQHLWIYSLVYIHSLFTKQNLITCARYSTSEYNLWSVIK